MEELDRIVRSMDAALSMIKDGTRPPDLDQALGGAADVMDAARMFESRWSDGRHQLEREGEQLRDKVREVLDAFTATDDQTSKELA